MTVRYLTKHMLTRVIEVGEREDYNRQVERRLLEDMNGGFLVNAHWLMLHRHKQFEPAYPHARAGLQVKLRRGGIARCIVDMPLDLWESLPTSPHRASGSLPRLRHGRQPQRSRSCT